MTATLFLICGMIGAGKTRLARTLAAERGALRLSPDEWLVALAGDRSKREVLDRFRDPVESIQWSLAMDLLARGLDVILENGFWSESERHGRLAEARRLGWRVELHYLDVPLPVLKERIVHRNAHGGPADIPVTPDEVEYWFRLFAPPGDAEGALYDAFVVHGP